MLMGVKKPFFFFEAVFFKGFWGGMGGMGWGVITIPTRDGWGMGGDGGFFNSHEHGDAGGIIFIDFGESYKNRFL